MAALATKSTVTNATGVSFPPNIILINPVNEPASKPVALCLQKMLNVLGSRNSHLKHSKLPEVLAQIQLLVLEKHR